VSFAPGTRLGQYEVTGYIGAGGMGEVLLATDTRLDRQVALKVLSSEFSLDSDRRRRFMREARAAAGLSHPGVATIYDVGEDSGVGAGGERDNTERRVGGEDVHRLPADRPGRTEQRDAPDGAAGGATGGR